MWLYVPSTSTSSPSAPAAEASISVSSWQFRALAQSAWWRGKPSQSRHWYQRWNRVSWLKLLCGAMPEPSMADAGVDAWTASLAASRVSRTALPDGSKGNSIIAISGPTRGASSSSRDLGSSSSRTSAACSRRGLTKSLERNEYSETFQSLVLRLREDCLRRQKSARATSGSASLSSLWPTMRSGDSAVNQLREGVTDARGRIEDAVAIWRASDGEKGGPNQAFGVGGIPLPAQSVQWSTPSVADVQGGRMTRSKERSDELLLNGQADQLTSSLQDRIIYPVGQVSSSPRRSLNPLFVEWLMGWPHGWTLSVSTDFACSATELSRFKQRMRSALLQLGLPAEAPPAQLALFG